MAHARRNTVSGLLAVMVFALILGERAPQMLAGWQVNQAGIVLAQALLPGKMGLSQSEQILRLQRAEMLLEQLGERYPSQCTMGIVLNQARAKLALQDYATVIAMLEHRLATCTNDRLAQFWLGQAYQAEGRWDKAVSTWQRAGAVVWLQELGNELAQQGMWAEALPAYLAVLELQPDSCVYRVRAGNAMWWGKQDLAGAMERFQRATELCPDQVAGYVAAGRVLIETRSYPEAERWAMLAQEVDATSELPLTVLALSRLRQNRPAEAVPYLHEALELNPNSTEARVLLGSAYSNLGLLGQAVQELEEAIQTGPAAAWHYDALGIAYEKLGDRANAIAAYRKALELDPTWQGARDRLLRLQETQ